MQTIGNDVWRSSAGDSTAEGRPRWRTAPLGFEEWLPPHEVACRLIPAIAGIFPADPISPVRGARGVLGGTPLRGPEAERKVTGRRWRQRTIVAENGFYVASFL